MCEWVCVCVCQSASSQITPAFCLDVAPGPPGCSGEVSSAQGNPLGDDSRAQLEEVKELNADWVEDFDQRGI